MKATYTILNALFFTFSITALSGCGQSESQNKTNGNVTSHFPQSSHSTLQQPTGLLNIEDVVLEAERMAEASAKQNRITIYHQ